jgi:transposase-like protein
MICGCPNTECEFYQKKTTIKRDGTYYRKDDSRKIPRFKCNACGKKFSTATFKLEWRQKKRRVNIKLFELLSSNVSMRRCARLLRINRTTVHRKLIYLAEKSRLEHKKFLQHLRADQVSHLQFDDLISSIHTKLKPVSISIAVDANRRFILGAEVGSIPSFGNLAELSRKKYGKRKNEHEEKLQLLFLKVAPVTHELAEIRSDEHRAYLGVVQKFFPKASYHQFKGERATVAGQGELKKIHYDPLFSINHTCATFRGSINRLIRRTWCTSKRMDMLQNHIDILIHYHNRSL